MGAACVHISHSMERAHGRLFQKMLHDAAYCGSLGPALLGRVGCLPTLLGRGLERAVRRLAATLTATCRSNCPRRCEPSGCAHPESLRHCPKLICRTCSLQGNEDVRSEMRCPDRCRVRVVASWLTITLVSLPGGAFQPSSSSFSSSGRRSSRDEDGAWHNAATLSNDAPRCVENVWHGGAIV